MIVIMSRDLVCYTFTTVERCSKIASHILEFLKNTTFDSDTVQYVMCLLEKHPG